MIVSTSVLNMPPITQREQQRERATNKEKKKSGPQHDDTDHLTLRGLELFFTPNVRFFAIFFSLN